MQEHDAFIAELRASGERKDAALAGWLDRYQVEGMVSFVDRAREDMIVLFGALAIIFGPEAGAAAFSALAARTVKTGRDAAAEVEKQMAAPAARMR